MDDIIVIYFVLKFYYNFIIFIFREKILKVKNKNGLGIFGGVVLGVGLLVGFIVGIIVLILIMVLSLFFSW